MKKALQVLPWLGVAALLTGCMTGSTVTNLTPRELPRNANNLYLFEVALDSNQQTLREETLKPAVVIGFDSYPMRPALMLSNRWEALVPVSGTNKFVPYRYKFDYDYNRFGPRGKSSRLSPPYLLEITEQDKVLKK
jgi:hypothetical protein